jgi:glutathione S-transferase
MITIWGRANSTNVQKVLWACDELGVEYRRVDLGGPFGGTDDPGYRAKNPNGLVPTLEEGDFTLWESNAILRYLAAGDPEQRLLPADLDRRARANIDRWMDWQLVSLGLSLRAVVMALRSANSVQPAATEAAIDTASEMFSILDAHLQGRRYVGGDQFSLGDIPVGISAHRWFSLGVRRPRTPALTAWYARISERPGFQRVRLIPWR